MKKEEKEEIRYLYNVRQVDVRTLAIMFDTTERKIVQILNRG